MEETPAAWEGTCFGLLNEGPNGELCGRVAVYYPYVNCPEQPGLVFHRPLFTAFHDLSQMMSPTMTSTLQAATSTLFMDRNLGAVGDFFTPNYVAHVTGRDVTGQAVVEGFLGMIHQAFQDLQVDLEILLVGEDRIAWQRTFRATHTGKFLGFPASGKPMIWRDLGTSRFVEGRIAEEWVVTDLAERFLLAKKGG
jgi:predicted ester cyclase